MSKQSSKYSQGTIIQTANGEVEILRNLGTRPTRLIIRFTATGYMTECRATNLISNKVKDHRLPSVYGVGYLDGVRVQPRGTEQRRIYDLWANMLKRAYGGYDISYQDVTVDTPWLSFKTFLNTFSDIPNYEAFLRGEDVHLDKDLRVPENRMYSLQTCQFISALENTTHARNKGWGKA